LLLEDQLHHNKQLSISSSGFDRLDELHKGDQILRAAMLMLSQPVSRLANVDAESSWNKCQSTSLLLLQDSTKCLE
jgi:hypothetical protein